MHFVIRPQKWYNYTMNLKSWRRKLKNEFIDIDGNKISIYKNLEESKPIAVLFHGFGGNYFGLTPLGFELSKKYSIIICELPAHGKSSLNTFQNIDIFRIFYQKMISKLSNFGEIHLIVGHSFSSYFVSDDEISKKIPTIIINPVFEPSDSFLAGMKLLNKSRFLMIFSNLPVFSPFKAATLQKTWSLEANKNIYQNMFLCQNSAKNLLAQKSTIPIALDKKVFETENYIKIAIIGDKDGTVQPFNEEEFRKNFPKSDFHILENSGHLSPMEKPREIAKIIFENIK